MDKNFFKELRILDGGMGQELHAKGLVSKGTLWSTSAVLDKKYHDLIIDCHLAYISAGAEVIITNNFSSRRIRMEQNKVNHLFEFANIKACELAIKARERSNKKIVIGGSLPAQHDTYKEDIREDNIIYKGFSEQVSCIKDYVDFFYLDVISSGRETNIASEVIDEHNKPILVGLHLNKRGKLPSGETITEVVEKYKHSSWIGIIASCVSMEIAENSISELKKQNLPFGYKVNLWGEDEPSPVREINSARHDEDAINLNTVMGKKEVADEVFKNLGKKFLDNGATIIGGCCETNPIHISLLSKLKKDFA